jgi:hypothetical protein
MQVRSLFANKAFAGKAGQRTSRGSTVRLNTSLHSG